MTVDRDLALLAQRQVSNRVALTGQLVPAPVVDDAGDLLAAIWTVGQAHGITATDWRLVVCLPQVVVDVLIVTRPRREGDDT